MAPIVETSGLSKRYGRLTAVDNLDLSVGEGEVFGFLGPNGAGKSTTLRIMTGLIRPSGGSARLFGRDIWRERRAALRDVGALIETPAFYKYLSGRDNLRILANTGGDCTAKEIDAALDTVGLLDRARDKVRGYSQGMRQRLGIALAIVGKPKLVLLDEPTNGLDPQGMKEVRDLIKRLSCELSLTVFLSSHLLNEVEQVCDRIGVINKGKLITSGKVTDLLGGPSAYEIEVDQPDRARQIIAGLDWVSVESAPDCALSVRLTRPAHELNKILVESGIGVSALIPRKTSLEELYLQLMQSKC